ncbi:MAG: hypothetical protein WCO11_00695 [Sphingomonadales bacterium]|jgi:hypothetical protein
MRSAPLEIALLLALAAPAGARPKPAPLPPLPPLVLPAAAPQIDATIAGQPVRLTVDFSGDAIVQINPDVARRLMLPGEAPGTFRVAVGQAGIGIPYSREIIAIDGRSVEVRVLAPAAPPPGQAEGSDGSISLALLPHPSVTLRWRAAGPGDITTRVATRTGLGNSIAFDWPLPGQNALEVELDPLRPISVTSVAGASRIAGAGAGTLNGAVRRVEIGYGVARPVRPLLLARPLRIAGITLRSIDVRLFDWAGKADLPPDAEGDDALAVVGRRGRQRGWPIVRLGRDALQHCASIQWQRSSRDPAAGAFEFVCPA